MSKTNGRARGRKTSPSHVIGIGGSAGSLHPLEELLRGLPATTSASVVVVTHRRPDEGSMMVDILSRATSMRVREVSHGAAPERGVVDVVPSDKLVAIRKGRFQLRAAGAHDRAAGRIDSMFRALADALAERSVGVVLSGMGSDGTVGLAAIKASLGLALVQAPSSADYDAMPASAVASGIVDFVGTPSELAEHLQFLAPVERRARPPSREAADTNAEAMAAILASVRTRTSHDFTEYKRSTLERRIDRRLNIRHVRTLSDYAELLRREPGEIDSLFGDLLIGVTKFFRDPEVFEALKRVLPDLLDGRSPGRPFRAWIAGCATGEEAYSLAIVLREVWEERHPHAALAAQIYATDLDSAAIDRARQGSFGPEIAADVSAARLARHFVEESGRYRVKKTIRDMLVFAPHNIISDPPFTKLDLLSCRNVFIYLDLELQRKVLPLFAHALVPGGLLLLGSSEGASGLGKDFSAIGNGLKLFRRDAASRRNEVVFPLDVAGRTTTVAAHPPPTTRRDALPALVQQAITEHLAPPVIVVDAKGDLLFASQRTGRYLEPPAGQPTVNVFAMAREGLALPLRTALQRALAPARKPRARPVRAFADVRGTRIELHAWALGSREFPRATVIAFIEAPRPKKDATKDGAKSRLRTVAELRETKAQLETLMSDTTASQEALQQLNEEMQSANEELQSTNEELTTSKEEMQSMNEELLSLNTELQTKNEQLAVANDDMRNLLDSSQIPTLFLDGELRMKRYTEQASRIARLIPTDIGRPITDLAWSIRHATLAADVREVLRTLVFSEAEVTADDGRSYMMRIHPYRTIDEVIDGVVITFLEVTNQKQAATRIAAREKQSMLGSMMEHWPGLAYVEEVGSGRTAFVSPAAEGLLGYPLSVLTNANDAFWRTLHVERPSARRRATKAPATVATEMVSLRRSDGTVVSYEEVLAPLRADGDPVPSHVVHIFRRRKVARELGKQGESDERKPPEKHRPSAEPRRAPRRARSTSRRATRSK